MPSGDETSETLKGESMEEDTTAEEGVVAKTRKTETVPSAKEVEEHNVDHGVFRQWCPHCVKGRAESYGHKG